MSNLISDPNAKNSIEDTAIELKKNLNYIKKFGLPSNITQYIDFELIFFDIYNYRSIII